MKWALGILVVALLLLWAAGAFAANCIAVVFHDPGAPDEFPYVLTPWSGVSDLQPRLTQLPVAAVHVYYTQFGAQGGPTAENFSGTTKSALGLKYVAPTTRETRERLIVSKFDPASSQQQDQGSIAIYVAALDATENVTVFFPPNINDSTAFTVLVGSEIVGGRGITDIRAGGIADDMGTGEIRTDVRENGCP